MYVSLKTYWGMEGGERYENKMVKSDRFPTPPPSSTDLTDLQMEYLALPQKGFSGTHDFKIEICDFNVKSSLKINVLQEMLILDS